MSRALRAGSGWRMNFPFDLITTAISHHLDHQYRLTRGTVFAGIGWFEDECPRLFGAKQERCLTFDQQ